MAFPKSRILSTQQLIREIIESNRNGERFCFILGSGASVESGIPSGNALEMRWMDCIMGEADDFETPRMDSETTRKCAKELYKEKLIKNNFSEIEKAWKEAKNSGKPISSEYYFDIYKLRFYPNQRNGYRYLERIMEQCEPSLGYHSLALMLTRTKLNNLVITTNFDSLVEDALFLYTDKRPLVVSHESLAGYIESDIQRPIVAKVHRGLMYAPFNSPETTDNLKAEWREALNYAFNTYTPIVIGYGGGDHSLMSFLKEETTAMRHGIYWCYRQVSGLPEEDVQKFVKDKKGYMVEIGGFDALMMEIGNALYKEEITPSGTDAYLKNQYHQRVQQYNEQWDELNKKPELEQVLQPMNEAEQHKEEQREKENMLTTWDYARRGKRAHDDGNYQQAIEEYAMAIKRDPNNAVAYNNMGVAYKKLNSCDEALKQYIKAVEIDPDYATAHNNIGTVYHDAGKYEEAIEEYTKAIELGENYSVAYNNRGITYKFLGEHEKAIQDYATAIKMDPKYKNAYLNRAKVYRTIGENNLADEDEKIAAGL